MGLAELRGREKIEDNSLQYHKSWIQRYKIWVVVAVLVILALFIALFIHYFYPSRGTEMVYVTIEEGESTSSIADKLHQEGVVTSALLFRFLAWIEGKQDDFKAGQYVFNPGMHYGEVFSILEEGPNYLVRVTIPEGLTVNQTAATVAEATNITVEEFEAAATSGDYQVPFIPPENQDNLEGFLFPKTYEFEAEASARSVVERLLSQFEIEVVDLDWTKAEGLGVTPYETVILASLIEREAILDDERPLVAAVIYNRLNAGMRLQIDATVQYALPQWKDVLTYEDLETPSPYNTYLHFGLPPAPICSPGKSSMVAALNPAEVDYIYYVAIGDGSHFFTSDYDEFLRVKNEVQNQ
jgi:UPF0755 protein